MLFFSSVVYIFGKGRFILAVAWLASLFVFVSFLFDVGEVYNYSDWYKRAFWYFGDDLTTWLTPLFLYAVLMSRRTLSGCLAGAVFMSGGRMGLLLLTIQILILVWLYRYELAMITRVLALPLTVGLVIYFGTLSLSPYAIKAGNTLAQAISRNADLLLFEPSMRGYGNCRTQSCFETKIKRPFRMRSLSAVAGLWMTLDGGFPGSRFPNTPERFADLMESANPWGVNDRYDVSRAEWMKIGTVQSPYLGFGAGYGPALLSIAMGFIGAVCLVGILSLWRRPPDAFSEFTIFFIVNAIFNQTQAWLLPGPVLFAMGFCGTHILWQFFSQDRDASTRLLLSAGISGKDCPRTG